MPLPAHRCRLVQAPVKTVMAPDLSLRGAKRRGNLSRGLPRWTGHVVKEKDSLYKIAKAHGVRVKDIMRQNPFVNVYNLQIGDELCVPGFTNVIEGAFIPYVVKKGETILDIAKMHKTTVENFTQGFQPP